jgi:hypothetical protein
MFPDLRKVQIPACFWSAKRRANCAAWKSERVLNTKPISIAKPCARASLPPLPLLLLCWSEEEEEAGEPVDLESAPEPEDDAEVEAEELEAGAQGTCMTPAAARCSAAISLGSRVPTFSTPPTKSLLNGIKSRGRNRPNE